MRMKINEGKIYVLACSTEGQKCYQFRNKVKKYEKKSLFKEYLYS